MEVDVRVRAVELVRAVAEAVEPADPKLASALGEAVAAFSVSVRAMDAVAAAHHLRRLANLLVTARRLYGLPATQALDPLIAWYAELLRQLHRSSQTPQRR